MRFKTLQSDYTTARRIFRHIYRLNYTATLIGFVGFFLALTPSLLPRSPFFLGVVAGFGFSFGYDVGLLIARLISWVGVHAFSKNHTLLFKRIVVVFLAVLVPIFSIEAITWQNEVRQLTGMNPLVKTEFIKVIVISFLTASCVLIIMRLFKRFFKFIRRLTGKISFLPKRIITVLSATVSSLIIILLFNGVLRTAFVNTANWFYADKNNRTDVGISANVSSSRSGSPASYVDWRSLGRQGRNFIGTGPTQQQLTYFNHAPASEPIRIYVGMKSAPTPEERVNLAMKELNRTGAFKRDYLAIILPTGTGWIEPQLTDSLEYIHNGDTAIVGIQYSWLPSWISSLADRNQSSQSAKLLFDSIYKKWHAMDENDRPKLIISGWSLGAYGLETIFSGADDLSLRTDGAMFVGTPHFTKLWQDFTLNRDKGSTEILPVYDKGAIVRFASTKNGLTKDQTNWKFPRTLFLQHGSDPIPWWSVDLILRQPDWLKEPRAPDVSDNMHWIPIITFMQVTIDLLNSNKVPDGHGHVYNKIAIEGWLAIAPRADWSQTMTLRLQEKLRH